MGYESRLYIVEKSGFYTNCNETPNDDFGRMCFAEVVAMIDLCKVPELPAAINKYPDTDAYIYEGEERVLEDKYGARLKEIPLKDMTDIITKIAKADNNQYRRWNPCLGLLKGFDTDGWDVVVLHYGH